MSQSEHNTVRLRRADSWLRRSEMAEADEEKFIFLWIAFNAAYGVELSDSGEDETESTRFRDFLGEILKRDREGVVGTLLWKTYPGPIRVLLQNHYVFGPFWKWNSGSIPNWRSQFEARNTRVLRSMERGDAHSVLSEVFMRLYVLRNQIFHGGTTFAVGLGREQIRDGTNIMASLVPAILEIMREDIAGNPGSEVWGKVFYPRVDIA